MTGGELSMAQVALNMGLDHNLVGCWKKKAAGLEDAAHPVVGFREPNECIFLTPALFLPVRCRRKSPRPAL